MTATSYRTEPEAKEFVMVRRIVDAPRVWKIAIVLLFDALLVPVALFLAICMRMGAAWPWSTVTGALPLFVVMTCAGIGLALVLRVPQVRHSSLDLGAISKIGTYAMMLAVIGTVLNAGLSLGAPRTVPMIFGPILFCLSAGGKLAGFGLLRRLRRMGRRRVNVAVYGAGAAGIQLISALSQSREFRITAIVDDNRALHGVVMGGVRVRDPSTLTASAARGRFERVLLAMPSVPKARQAEIARRLEHLPCEVQALPGYVDLVNSGDLRTELGTIDASELLCRGAVELNMPRVTTVYAGRTILIAGAGGSIGGELCRQVIGCGPRKLVLLEHSEYALYAIDREIRPLAAMAGVEISTQLGSICDRARIDTLLHAHHVDTILHAAAYKHVPLVEANALEGVRNNVLGTHTLAEAARQAGVERFILISTDKAVRPTNVMGATKRLAEMIVQDLQSRSSRTKFALVRFGNVLGSSGSVVPLFQEQIAAGGPVTLTHPEVSRYFMTLPEAARLVLIAGSYAEGGDMFVLDMGQPVRIADLARRMIELSGLQVRDANSPDGDIEIRVTGLRPGEKLYEELLIGTNILETPHPKILRAEEACPSEIEVAGLIKDLRLAVENQHETAVRNVINRWVEGFGGAVEPALAQAAE